MVKVAYLWTDFPGMPRLALDLRESIGWEPVLWLGWAHLAEPVADAFPCIPWQHITDAEFCRPINGVTSAQPQSLDEPTWVSLQQYLPRLMNQMNRYGPPEHFLYEEREAYARKLLMHWHEALTVTRTELAFFEESPSVPFSYAAWVMCHELGIATVTMFPTKVPGLSLLREGIEAAPLLLAEAYGRRLASHDAAALSPRVQEALDAVLTHQEFLHRHEIMVDAREQLHRRQSEQAGALTAADGRSNSSRFFTVGAKALRALNVRKWPLFLRNLRTNLALKGSAGQTPVRPFSKLPGVRMGAESCALATVQHYSAQRTPIKNRLESYYRNLCVEPKFSSDRFVYFPLHYRPERTSNPDGGVFFDQFLPLAMISESLPDGWKLYVKEHGVQFHETMQGECGRTEQFYDDIAGLRGVQFIAPDVSSKKLILQSQAVASITGTACWEAAVLKKPALYFGFPWYQSCPGTARVTSALDVRAVLDHPDTLVASDSELHAWHAALSDAGVDYQFNAWQTDPESHPEHEQYAGLKAALEWWHLNRFDSSPASRPSKL